MKIYELPPHFEDHLNANLKTLGFKLDDIKALQKAILQVSDSFQAPDSTTPWHKPQAAAAYYAYFHPLNTIRLLKVFDELKKRVPLNEAQWVVDYGCGPGTAGQLLSQQNFFPVEKVIGVDHVPDLKKMFLNNIMGPVKTEYLTSLAHVKKKNSLLVASYVLNELPRIPESWFHFETVIVVEPSTKQCFPRLLELREKLIEKGFQVVAPCPHHETCPLKDSKKDWCHDRVHWSQPRWFQRIEDHLPIKNKTLSFSYLIATRKPTEKSEFVRVVGDEQKEKGKTRWMICRNQEREFYSHLKKMGPPPEMHRGDTFTLENFEKKGNEIRPLSDS